MLISFRYWVFSLCFCLYSVVWTIQFTDFSENFSLLPFRRLNVFQEKYKVKSCGGQTSGFMWELRLLLIIR